MSNPVLLKPVTDLTLDRVVWSAEKPVLVDFHASWCGACPSMLQLIASLEPTYPQIDFRSCDADENTRCAAELGVRSLPFLVLVHGTDILATHQGLAPKSVISSWLSTLVEAHGFV